MRGARLLATLTLPLAAACGGSTSTITEAPAPRGATTADISPADLRKRISIFADDSMQGRRTGTPGNVKGNAYIVRAQRRAGGSHPRHGGQHAEAAPGAARFDRERCGRRRVGVDGAAYDADGHPDNFYCRSDHYMYARHGIPIAFFSTGGHRDYHQVTDEIEYLDFDKYTRATKFVGAVADRVANLDRRPVVDKPKPDLEAPCQQ